MRQLTDAETFEMGRLSEFVVLHWLRHQSHIDNIKHTGGGGEKPFEGAALYDKNGKSITPDVHWRLLADRRYEWGEIKCHTVWTWHRRTQQWRTGCALVTERTALAVRYKLSAAQQVIRTAKRGVFAHDRLNVVKSTKPTTQAKKIGSGLPLSSC